MAVIDGVFVNSSTGKAQDGATAKLWEGAAFATPPAKNEPLPSVSFQVGSSVTTGSDHGSDGAYRFTGVSVGDYWISIEYNGNIGWQAAHVGVATSDFPGASTITVAKVKTSTGEFVGRPWYDVRAYGALGDGSNDDRAAIVAAVAAANAAGGGEVYIPAGVHKVSSAITVLSNVTLRGEGHHTVVSTSADTPGIQVASAASHAVIRDLKVVGLGNVLSTSNRGVHMSAVSNVLVENVRTIGCFRGISIAQSNDVNVVNSWVEDDVGTLGAVDVSDASERVRVENVTVLNAGTHGIDIRGINTNYNSVVNCTVISASNTGIVVSADSVGSSLHFGNRIIGNAVVSAGVNGMIIENGCVNTIVEGNVVQASGADGISVSDGTGSAPVHTVVANNIIRSSTTHGIFDNGGVYVTIEGNHVAVYGSDGIRCGAGSGVKVIGNTVTDGSLASGRGIVVYSSLLDAPITGNMVRNVKGYGITVDAERAVVTGNSVIGADNGGTLTIGGIRLTSNASRTVVTGNVSKALTGTQQDYGIQVDASCTNAMIVANNFQGNSTAASLDNGTGTTFANNITT